MNLFISKFIKANIQHYPFYLVLVKAKPSRKFATTLVFLVANKKNQVANATVSVAISSPGSKQSPVPHVVTH